LRRPFLLACLIVATFLPLLGSLFRWQGLPEGYGLFPPQQVTGTPGFHLWYFSAGCLLVLGITLFLSFPRLFGFKAVEPAPQPTPGPFPYWFAPGLVVMLVSWALMWFGSPLAARFTFVPLWWGFIFALDGWVYSRTNGASLVAGRKHEMLILAIVSAVGWHLFEFLNYFVLADWYYPYSHLLTPFGNLVWYTLSYTTVWPVCFEWYMLLASFPALRQRWANGPRLTLPKSVLVATLVVGFALLFLLGVFPYPLFWALWVAPLAILGAALHLAGFWTPFAPVARGDWSRLMLIALATMLNGFVWELWNYGSQAFRDVPANPNYWVYDVPYMNVIHLFSEMPMLGYFGYLFFGVLVWLVWLTVAHVIDIEPDFAHRDAIVAGASPVEDERNPAAAGQRS
jgi:hypothetical protein